MTALTHAEALASLMRCPADMVRVRVPAVTICGLCRRSIAVGDEAHVWVGMDRHDNADPFAPMQALHPVCRVVVDTVDADRWDADSLAEWVADGLIVADEAPEGLEAEWAALIRRAQGVER